MAFCARLRARACAPASGQRLGCAPGIAPDRLLAQNAEARVSRHAHNTSARRHAGTPAPAPHGVRAVASRREAARWGLSKAAAPHFGLSLRSCAAVLQRDRGVSRRGRGRRPVGGARGEEGGADTPLHFLEVERKKIIADTPRQSGAETSRTTHEGPLSHTIPGCRLSCRRQPWPPAWQPPAGSRNACEACQPSPSLRHRAVAAKSTASGGDPAAPPFSKAVRLAPPPSKPSPASERVDLEIPSA